MKYSKYAAITLALSLALTTGCKKDDEVMLQNPVAGDSFENVENEGYWVQLNAEAAASGQIGTWGIVVGNGGHFEDKNNPASKFMGEPGEHYVLSWEVRDGDVYKTDEITVSFKAMEAAIKMTPVDTIHNNISLHLRAENPKFGATGHWELISGDQGRIENAESLEAAFIGVEDREYTVRWKQTYGSKVDFVDYTFRTDSLRAMAGEDDEDVLLPGKWDEVKFYTLRGHTPAGGTGSWSIMDGEGASIYDSENPTSLMEAQGGNFYKLLWNVEVNGRASVDTLELQFRNKYGKWIDPRDGQEYRTVVVGEYEWLAQNLRYADQPGEISLYYGLDAGNLVHGEAVDTQEEKERYGRLYHALGWLNVPDFWNVSTWHQIPQPDGWFMPSTKDWLEVVRLYGGIDNSRDRLYEGGDSGLDLVMAGHSTYPPEEHQREYLEQEKGGYYHTSTYAASDDGFWLQDFMFVSSGGVSNGKVGMFNHGFAIRLIRKPNYDY